MTKHCVKSNLKPLSDDEAMNDFDFTAFISQSLLNAPIFLESEQSLPSARANFGCVSSV